MGRWPIFIGNFHDLLPSSKFILSVPNVWNLKKRDRLCWQLTQRRGSLVQWLLKYGDVRWVRSMACMKTVYCLAHLWFECVYVIYPDYTIFGKIIRIIGIRVEINGWSRYLQRIPTVYSKILLYTRTVQCIFLLQCILYFTVFSPPLNRLQAIKLYYILYLAEFCYIQWKCNVYI